VTSGVRRDTAVSLKVGGHRNGVPVCVSADNPLLQECIAHGVAVRGRVGMATDWVWPQHKVIIIGHSHQLRS
jgi:hypothetical protein